MSETSEGGAMRQLEQARLDAAAREAQAIAPQSERGTSGRGGIPATDRTPAGSPVAPAPASAEAPKVIREVLLNGTVVVTNVTPPPPQPPRRDHEYAPRTKRANPADYHGLGRKMV